PGPRPDPTRRVRHRDVDPVPRLDRRPPHDVDRHTLRLPGAPVLVHKSIPCSVTIHGPIGQSSLRPGSSPGRAARPRRRQLPFVAPPVAAPRSPTRIPAPTSTPPTTTCTDGTSRIAGSAHAMIVAPTGSPSVARLATYAGM